MINADDLFYVDKVINGDISSFSHLVEKYKRPAYTLALRIVKNEEDAEDISQDSFLKVFQSLKKFKRESSFSTWLYRIVYNTSVSHLRRMKMKTTSLEIDQMELNTDQIDNSFQQLVKEEQSLYLNYALDKLSEREVAIIYLYYSQEKNMSEIASIMKLTHVNVRAILTRARHKLCASLEQVLKNNVKDLL